jgi:hypothetical protein
VGSAQHAHPADRFAREILAILERDSTRSRRLMRNMLAGDINHIPLRNPFYNKLGAYLKVTLMRGQLSDSRIAQINALLPSVDKVLFIATIQGPGVDFYDLTTGHQLGVALVCLEDAQHRFFQARSTLREAYACLAWYREEVSTAPQELDAVVAAKFYADYAALLLYATAEDLSYFIIHFLGIEMAFAEYLQDKSVQRKLERAKIASNAAKVGLFLNEKHPDHELSKVAFNLHTNPNWQQSLKYRNTWVHDKPPIVRGLGTQFDRNSRVIREEDRAIMYIGSYQGSEPQFDIDQLLHIEHEAIAALANSLDELAKLVIIHREAWGEKFVLEGNRVSVPFTVRYAAASDTQSEREPPAG